MSLAPSSFLWLLGYQAVWLITAFTVARGHAWIGILAAAVLLAVRWIVSRERQNDAVLVGASIAAGLVVENAIAALGLVTFRPSIGVGAAPLWLLALWATFGVTLPATAVMLGARPAVKSMLLGLLGAPLAYWAGHRLEALTLAEPLWQGLVAYGIAWMCAMPALFAVLAALDRRNPQGD